MTLDKIIPYSPVGIVILLALVEIVPIKINPWSWIVKKVGNALNGDLIKKVDNMGKDLNDKVDSMGKDLNDKVDNLSVDVNKKIENLHGDVLAIDAKNDECEAVTWRYRILCFGDECLHGVHHSKERFDQILEDITKYTQYCDEHPKFKNDKAVQTIKIIEEVFRECSRENTFLK